MDDLIVTGGLFEVIEDGNYVLRLFAGGTGFAAVSRTVTAVVGDVPVDLVVHNPNGDGFSGMLATVPPEGAVLRVGWTPDSMADTAVTFSTVADV